MVRRVLDDGAADDPKLKSEIKMTIWHVELLAPINPRRRGPIRNDLPRGIDHLTSRGVPVCQAGFPFELLGFRQDTEHFIFTAPEAYAGRIGLFAVCFAGRLLSGAVGRSSRDDRRGSVAVVGPSISAAFQVFCQGDGPSHGDRADP